MSAVGSPEALRHLRRHAVLRRIIEVVGPCTLRPSPWQPYEALVRAVLHQQLHGRAAEAILRRLLKACSAECHFPSPQALLALGPEAMRECGLSAHKIRALCDIAEKAALGAIPTRAEAMRMTEQELFACLLPLRGVGRWTVEMLLIFTLGRPDILPVDDFGIREGYRLAAGLAAQPKPRELTAIGSAWAPYRTTAAWYLWRAVDLAKAGDLPPASASPAIATSLPSSLLSASVRRRK